MKKTIRSMFETGVLQLLVLAVLIVVMFATSGCKSPQKMRDIELKGMYVNGYSEVLALGWGRLTSIPGDKEALAAHYEEDTAWLQPNLKTHKIDIFLVGKNSAENSPKIIEDICKAFAEVAPSVAKENAEVAKSVATVTPLGVVKAGGEVRKTTELAKTAVKEIKAKAATTASGQQQATGAATSQESGVSSQESGLSDPHCADGACTNGGCTDCEVK